MQLDGQRQPVHAAADRRADVGEGGVVGEGGLDTCHPVADQRDAIVRGQTYHGDEHLARHRQPCPAGREDPQARAAGQQPAHQRGDLATEVFARVEDEHRGALVQPLDQPLRRRSTRFLPHGAGGEHRVGDPARAHRRQLREPAQRDRPRGLDHEPGLPGTTRPDRGDQPAPGQRVPECGQLVRPPHQGGERGRRAHRCRVPQRATAAIPSAG
ncbi:MAG: hypothetical protein ACT4RN_15225 [Pseudonocardia sp.]